MEKGFYAYLTYFFYAYMTIIKTSLPRQCTILIVLFVCVSGEEGEGSMMSDEERREVVSLETWLNKPDIVYSCQCREVDSNGFLHPRYVTIYMSR